jgi:hypothetical protein
MLSDIYLIFSTLLCHIKIQIKFEFCIDPLIFHEVMTLWLRKISQIISFPHFFVRAFRYLFDIWCIALPNQHTDLFRFWFRSLILNEVSALGLRKNIICTFVVFPLPALQSRIVTNQNFVLLCLNYFWLNYTVGRGLGIACNTLRMLGLFFNFFLYTCIYTGRIMV